MKLLKSAKKYWYKICNIFIWLVIISMSGCTKDDSIIISDNKAKDIEISLNIVKAEHIDTRSRISIPDYGIQNLLASTVDGQGNIIQDNIPVSDLVYTSDNKYIGKLSLENYSSIKEIHFFANCTPNIPYKKSEFGNININFSPTTSPLETYLPMWGATNISNAPDKIKVNLLRSVTSCEIVSNTDKLQIKESILCNSKNIINVCPKDVDSTNDIFNPADCIAQENIKSVSGTNKYYFAEFKESSELEQRTCLIIKAIYNGENCFYRIDFHKDGKYFLPIRNTLYSFKIKDVTQKGYNSIEEALANTGANVQSIISVDITDNSNEIVVDGKYQFTFNAVNNAILNPQELMIMSFETNNSSEAIISETETCNWLNGLTLRRNGTYEKETIDPEGKPMLTTFYKWNLYGNFSNSESIKTDSPIWGKHSQQIKLTCGTLEKYIGISQSLISLYFMNYDSYVKTKDGREYRIGTYEYDNLDLNTVSARYQKGTDMRYKPHKLRVWLSWSKCSPNQSPIVGNTELIINKKIDRYDAYGNINETIEKQEKRNIDITQNGMIYFDIEMSEVVEPDIRCKNIIEIDVSSHFCLTSKLYIEQKYYI